MEKFSTPDSGLRKRNYGMETMEWKLEVIKSTLQVHITQRKGIRETDTLVTLQVHTHREIDPLERKKNRVRGPVVGSLGPFLNLSPFRFSFTLSFSF